MPDYRRRRWQLPSTRSLLTLSEAPDSSVLSLANITEVKTQQRLLQSDSTTLYSTTLYQGKEQQQLAH